MTASQPLPLAELSPAELAVIERFGIYEAEEKVARAILRAVLGDTDGGLVLDGDLPASEIARLIREEAAAAAIAAMPISPAEAAALVEGDWVSPSREAHARDLTKSWADAAQNAGCPAAFVARMRSFVEVHDRNYRAAIAAPQTGEHTTDEEGR